MTYDAHADYAAPAGDLPLTRAFLKSGAKLYKRGMHAINIAVVGSFVFMALDHIETHAPPEPDTSVADSIPPLPDAPKATSTAALPGLDSVPRPPMRTAELEKRFGEFSELDVPGIDQLDHAGVYGMSNAVSHTVRGPGHILGPVTAEMFGVHEFEISDNILKNIRSASRAEGVATFIMLTFAELESSFKPWEEADTSSAAGLFQITVPTLQGLLMRLGDTMGYGSYAKQVGYANEKTYWRDPAAGQVIEDMRLDPKHASRWAARLHVDNTQKIQNQIGRSLEPVEYYIAHFMGARMAPKFLRAVDRKPNAQIDANLWAKQIDANAKIFRNEDGGLRTHAEIMAWFDQRVGPVMAHYAMTYEEPGSEGYNWGLNWARENGVIDVYKHDPSAEHDEVAALAPR